MTYDSAVEAALSESLNGDQLYQDALDQWADSGTYYEPPAYNRDFQDVTEVSGYIGESLLMVLAEIAERKATR